MNRTLAPAAGALLLVLAACAGGFGRQPEAADDAAALRASVLALRQQVTVQELELARLRERIAALEAGRRLETPRAEHAGTTSSPRPSEELREPTYPPPAIEGADLPPGDTPRQGAEAPLAPQALYDRALALIQGGQQAEGEQLMRRFLTAYAESDLADNAAYWIGETRYSRGDWQGALEAFKAAVEQYPEGNKVADSLFKVGKSLEKLGDREGAREVLVEVSRRFPGTGAASAATEALRSWP